MKIVFIKEWKCPIREGRVWPVGKIVEMGDEYAEKAIKGKYAERANKVQIRKDKEKKVLESKVNE